MIEPPRRLRKNDDRSDFDCGKESLNTFLKQFAFQNQEKHNSSVTYVATEDGKVRAYYSVAFGSVTSAEAPEKVAKGLGLYPVPIFLLARLAVDKKLHGKGWGSSLLQDAISRACKASELAGLKAIVVDAMDKDARVFYSKYSFVESPTDEMRMFLTIKDAKHTLKL